MARRGEDLLVRREVPRPRWESSPWRTQLESSRMGLLLLLPPMLVPTPRAHQVGMEEVKRDRLDLRTRETYALRIIDAAQRLYLLVDPGL